MSHWVYIVECRDGSLYTGYTTDVDLRAKKHNSGKGAKYTRARRPVKVVYKKQFGSKIEAMREEFRIKQLSRLEKQKLILTL